MGVQSAMHTLRAVDIELEAEGAEQGEGCCRLNNDGSRLAQRREGLLGSTLYDTHRAQLGPKMMGRSCRHFMYRLSEPGFLSACPAWVRDDAMQPIGFTDAYTRTRETSYLRLLLLLLLPLLQLRCRRPSRGPWCSGSRYVGPLEGVTVGCFGGAWKRCGVSSLERLMHIKSTIEIRGDPNGVDSNFVAPRSFL